MILNLKVKTNKNKSSQTRKKIKQEFDDLKYAFIAANIAEEKKGEDILLLDVSRLTIIASYFLIITAKSQPQIQAISTNIVERLTKENHTLISQEGFVNSNWIVLDFGNLVVHIMNNKERDYYKLERFWSNAKIIDRKQWKKAS